PHRRGRRAGRPGPRRAGRRRGRPAGVRCGGAVAVRARFGGVPPRDARGVRGAGGAGGGGEGAPVRARTVRLSLNGRDVEALTPPHRTLLEVLREDLGAMEVMYGCGEGVCGTCTVLLDGESVNACTVLAVQADGRAVTTLAGLARDGELHPIQRSFL